MSISEKVEQSDLILYEIIKNPVLFGEFVNNIDKLDFEDEFEFTDYQKEFICDFNSYEELCCGRAVGKSLSLVNILLWALVYNLFPNDYLLYTVPSKVHLEPIMTGLSRQLRSNSFLKNFIEPRGGINNSDFTIKMLNNATLLCRIAGQTGTGANVIGLHSPFEILDEAGYYPWGTWLELQPTFNTWVPGCRKIVSGVPTGLRENNVLYHVDQENSTYTKHRISAYRNPRFTDSDKQRAIEQYGGEDSDDYIHFIMGQHGRPVFALFDRSNMEISNYPVYKLIFDGLISENLMDYINKLAIFPGLPDKSYKSLIGIDLGYTEPTAIFIMYIDNMNRIKFHGKITLNKVSYPIQEKFIDMLDTKFEPIIIGIDKGNVGISVIQRLQEDKEFLHKDYKNRLIPIDFSSSITLGIDNEGNEIKSKTKPFSVSVLQDYTNNHKIVYTSTDLETVAELERMTYSKNINGDIVYKTLTQKGGKKGEDHFTSALLCGALAYYLTNEYILVKREKVKLAKPIWLM
jgi:hypothetical protein